MSTFVCDDLRIGGTLSASGISGGTSINGTAYTVTDWSGIFGTVGVSGSQAAVFGSAGAMTSGDYLPLPRLFNLNLVMLDRNTSGGVTEPTLAEQKQANTDVFMGLATSRDPIPLEVDMPDGSSRFLQVYNNNPSPFSQPARLRTISLQLAADWGLWKEGGQESTDTINGADTLVVGGNQTVWDAVLVFSGNGTFTHSTLGWAIEITGAAGPVTVSLGPPPRTVTEGGNPASNRMRRTVVPGMGRIWGWFTVGSNSVTSTVSTTVTWRDQWA